MSEICDIKIMYNEYVNLIAIEINQKQIAQNYMEKAGFGMQKKEDLKEVVSEHIRKNGKTSLKECVEKIAKELIEKEKINEKDIENEKAVLKEYLKNPAREETFRDYASHLVKGAYEKNTIDSAIAEIKRYKKTYDPFELDMNKRNPITSPFFEILTEHLR